MYSTLATFMFPVLIHILGGLGLETNRKAAGDPTVINRTSNEEPLANAASLREQLLQEVTMALGGVDAAGDFGSDIADIEKVLLPIMATSPKNDFGRLEDAESRYALHRYFMQRHGWDMRTFVSSDKGEEEMTCLFDFGRQVPFAVQAALEKRIVDRGASIAELAVFVALLEHLVRDEVPGKVEAAYQAMEFSRTDLLNEEQATKLIDFHMSLQIDAEDASKFNSQKAAVLLERMPKAYAGWSFAQEMFRFVQADEVRNGTAYGFADMVRILTRLEKNITQLQTRQCQKMKNKLSDIEVLGSGRVRLSDFYNSALTEGNIEFMESLAYLRELGAVDENHAEPQVVISNYLDGPSNCIAASSYYSVCCPDECVELYTDLERALMKSTATPEEILSVMRRSEVLSGKQAERLQELARDHFGLVPLHGQAFAQWMHEVFPRECTDPSLSGPAHYMTIEEWAAKSGLNYAASVPEAQLVVDRARAAVVDDEVEDTVEGEASQEEDDVVSVIGAAIETASDDDAGSFGDDNDNDSLISNDGAEPAGDNEGGDVNSFASGLGEPAGDNSEDERSSMEVEAVASRSVSQWVPATRWVAVVLVVLLVPIRMLLNVYLHHMTKLSKDGLVKPSQPEMSDLEASIIMDRV